MLVCVCVCVCVCVHVCIIHITYKHTLSHTHIYHVIYTHMHMHIIHVHVCLRERELVYLCVSLQKSICMRPVLVIHMLGNQSWHLFLMSRCFLEQTIWINRVMGDAKRF